MWPYSEAETLDIVRQIARTVQPNSGEPAFLSKGSNNEVFLVPAGAGSFVVRVCGEWREITTLRERWSYERCTALGIPGPAVLGAGKVEKLPYLAMSFISGIAGFEYPHTDRLWETLGDYAARINGIRFDEDGEALLGAESAWRERVASCLDPARFAWVSSLMGWEPGFASEIGSRLHRLMEAKLRVGLSHGDIDPRNAIIAEDGEVYLIDWCCSRRGPIPHVDIYNILRETDPRGSSFAAYLKGYGLSPGRFDAVQGEVHAFGTAELIADLLWASKDRPDLVPDRSTRLRAHLGTSDGQPAN